MSKSNNGSNGNGHDYSTDEDEDSEIVSSPCGERPPLDAAHVPKKLWRHSSIEACASVEVRNEAKVLVLYTGGTIGMMRNEKGGKRKYWLPSEIRVVDVQKQVINIRRGTRVEYGLIDPQ
jgi:hypothetical protein